MVSSYIKKSRLKKALKKCQKEKGDNLEKCLTKQGLKVTKLKQNNFKPIFPKENRELKDMREIIKRLRRLRGL